MRVLVAHNRYQQMGGEDVVFETESNALEASGHAVRRLSFDNATIQTFQDKVRTTLNLTHNEASLAVIRKHLSDFKPDIVHVHNYFPILSPASLTEVAKARVPVIQTLHNYRALCANSMFFREQQVCEACLSGSKLNAPLHRCYRGSVIGSFAIGQMGSYLRYVSRQHPRLVNFIALTEFAKSRYIAGGFSEDQIKVKANALPDPGIGVQPRKRQILFVGRLSREKGADFLCRIAPHIKANIIIIGDGPDHSGLRQLAPANVSILGALPRSQVFEYMRESLAVAVPSRWYEACPMTVLEAFATGTPVIASRLGALAELIPDGIAGLLSRPDSEEEWIRSINALLSAPERASRMGHNARALYLKNYSQAANIAQLVDIYTWALKRAEACGTPSRQRQLKLGSLSSWQR